MIGRIDHRIVSHINFKSIRIVLLLLKYIYLYNVHLHVKVILSCLQSKSNDKVLVAKCNTAKQQLSLCHLCVL